MSNKRTQVLEKAASLINGDRQDDYGTPKESFRCIAEMWTAYLGAHVTRGDVCNMIALLKIARLRNGAHEDSSVDGAGYLALGVEVEE